MRALEVKRSGRWAATPAGSITLGHEDRWRRRFKSRTDQGLDLLLDLPEATQLREGDGLVLESGGIIEVRALREELCEVRGRDGEHLLRLAWHIGNRHLAAQLEGDRILILPDHVIEEMLRRLGASLRRVTEAFDPEGGAYGGAHSGHRHGA